MLARGLSSPGVTDPQAGRDPGAPGGIPVATACPARSIAVAEPGGLDGVPAARLGGERLRAIELIGFFSSKAADGIRGPPPPAGEAGKPDKSGAAGPPRQPRPAGAFPLPGDPNPV